MKYNFLFLLLMFFAACNNSETNFYTLEYGRDIPLKTKDFDFKGYVKNCWQVKIEELPEDLDEFDWGNTDEFETYEFDEERRIIGLTEIFLGKTIFNYNDDGVLTNSTRKAERININSYYEYDSDGKLKGVSKSNDSKSKISYNDDNGHLGIVRDYSSDGDLEITKYEYDRRGRLILEQNSYMSEETIYKGRKVKICHHYDIRNGGKTIITRMRYKYNMNGDLIEKAFLTEDDEEEKEYTVTYKYQYDTEKNWVMKQEIKGEQIQETCLRKIDYHKSRYFGILP